MVDKSVDELIRDQDEKELGEKLSSLIGFEIADIVTRKNIDQQVLILSVLTPEVAADTFRYLNKAIQKNLLENLPYKVTANILFHMPPDDRTSLLESLPKDVINEYVQLLPPEERTVALTLLGYPVGSAGRVMTTEYLAANENWTVEQIWDHMHDMGDVNKNINEIYIVNDDNELIGDLNVKDLFFAPKTATLMSICNRVFVSLSVLNSLDKAIQVFKSSGRLELPVVDASDRLLGVITIDDIFRLTSRKNTATIQKIGAVEELDVPFMTVSFYELIKKRARWLVILFIGEMLTATALGYFEDEISKAVVLALFLPLIISSGGNAGSQSTTLVIRSMALGECKISDWWFVFRREILQGAALGAILGSVGFLRISLWSSFSDIYGPHWLLVALTIFLALIGVVLWGSIMGVTLPFILRLCRIDPATSSNPLIATLVDVTGIIIYFVIAMWTLRGTLL
jgi:magnesium transporter